MYRQKISRLQMSLVYLKIGKKASKAEHKGKRQSSGISAQKEARGQILWVLQIRVRTLDFILHVKERH